MEINPSDEAPRIGTPLTDSERLGSLAREMYWGLNVELDEWVEGDREWIPSDNGSLYWMSVFEARIVNVNLDADTGGLLTADRRKSQAVSSYLAEYHDALPFSEAERRWISGVLSTVPRETRNSAEVLAGMKGELMSAGIRQTVDGNEVLRRWWSWRRQTGAFQDQESFGAARTALEHIAAILMPPSP